MQTRAFPFAFRDIYIEYYERETLILKFIGGIYYEKIYKSVQ